MQNFAIRKNQTVLKYKKIIFILSYDGENFDENAAEATYSHKKTWGLGKYKGQAFTTGCVHSTTCGRKTEVLDLTTMIWSEKADYPITHPTSVKKMSDIYCLA